MNMDQQDFVNSLFNFVQSELIGTAEAPEYNHDAVQIIDARNHLFRNIGPHETDEEMNIYSLQSLCRVDEEEMTMVPDKRRIEHVAHNYF